MTVAIIKLVSGDELISDVVVVEGYAPGQEIVHLVNPCQIERVYLEDGTVTAKFLPIAMYCRDQTIHTSNSNVVWTVAPEQGFEDAYNASYGKPAPEVAPEESPSGLILPEEKSLIVPA